MSDQAPINRDSSALSWSSSICSILGLIGVFVLQTFTFDDYTLLFWWITTVMIAIAAISVCFTPPSLPLRAIFAIVFVAQLPAFSLAWGEIYERDTELSLRLRQAVPSETETKIDELEHENAELKFQHRRSLLFWESISHLTGMGFALLACTSAGQSRVRIIYDAGQQNAFADLIGRKEINVHATGIDKYGRTLARVIFNGQDVTEVMVGRGMAWHYRTYSNDELLAELENKARASKLGLWADPNPLPPWEFRRNQSKPIDKIERETLVVVIDQLEYWIRPNTGEQRNELRKTELKDVIEAAKLTTGNSDGIRVKILRTENARASAEFTLIAELNSAGILTGIVMPDEFLPSSAAGP